MGEQPTQGDRIAVQTATGERFRDGVRACLPVVMGYSVIGLAFGVLARTAGLSAPEVALMSLILYAGSAQFILAGLLDTGAAASAIVITIFLVNVRHLLYSAALAPHVRRLPAWQNVLVGAELTDETFAVATNHLAGERAGRAPWLFGLNLTAQVTWIVATTVGALVGSAIPDTSALGLDFALAAMFAALLVLLVVRRPRLRPAVAVAATGVVVGVGGALVVPASWAIIAAAVVAASVGVAIEGRAAWK
jgi:4-azaleucine resistance transporter AzlC